MSQPKSIRSGLRSLRSSPGTPPTCTPLTRPGRRTLPASGHGPPAGVLRRPPRGERGHPVQYVTLEQKTGELLVKLMDLRPAENGRGHPGARVPGHGGARSPACMWPSPRRCPLRSPRSSASRRRPWSDSMPEAGAGAVPPVFRPHPSAEGAHPVRRGGKAAGRSGRAGPGPGRHLLQAVRRGLTFPDAVDAQGERHPLSNGSYTLLMSSEDRALRKSAFENLYCVYGGVKNTLAATLSAQVKQLEFFAKARKYPSALAASLDSTRVPEAVYHNLIAPSGPTWTKCTGMSACGRSCWG